MVFLCWFIWYIMCCVLSHMSTVRCPRMQWHFCCCLLVCSLACLLCVHFDFVIWLSHSPSGLSIINEKLFRTYLQLTESELTKVRFISWTKPGTTHTHTHCPPRMCVYPLTKAKQNMINKRNVFFFSCFYCSWKIKGKYEMVYWRAFIMYFDCLWRERKRTKKKKLLIGKCTMNAVRLP